ncbi:MAG: glutamyl-tRNA amidotransferase [Candidatus Rokuibacteriota bacterium]|nr:MAG: glutamyl-tRNA amidotransferase [Candidatus Rokubacteria bacterium]
MYLDTVMGDIPLAVNGTLMRGLELNGNLRDAGARFVREATTTPDYRLWSIGDRHPAMIRVRAGGVAIAVEVWDVPAAGLAQVLLQEPPGLCIGKVRLSDGQEALGVLGEPALCEGQLEITRWGGWRAYIAARDARPR